jgi:Phage tail assembly chaperone protein, TAC
MEVRRALEIACGILSWPPAVFWQATPMELAAAIAGLTERRAAETGAPMPLGRRDVQELRAWLQQQCTNNKL